MDASLKLLLYVNGNLEEKTMLWLDSSPSFWFRVLLQLKCLMAFYKSVIYKKPERIKLFALKTGQRFEECLVHLKGWTIFRVTLAE